MKYDFNKTTQRRNTNSRKWDVKDNELPMWVADMDFFVYPKIKEAIIEAANRGGYGYSLPTEKLFLAYQAWWQRRHHILIDTKDMIYVSGVVSALDSIIKLLTKEKDAVMLLSPSYSGFYSVVNNNNRALVTSNLLYQNDDWLIDYDDVEKKIVDHDVKALIFCNPHNPTGKVWHKEELMKITTICEKHHVYYISDEIHCDIVEPGKEYIPSLSVYDKTIMCSSPSKVFNLAGLQTAITVIKNKELRDRVEAAFYHDDVGEPNYFVESAVVAAYQDGDEYVDELNEYVYQNKLFVKEYFKKYLPHLKVVSKEGTYLLWIDISYYQIPSDVFTADLRKETGLYIHNGLHFGSNGTYYIRINVATSLDNVKDGLNRLKAFIDSKEIK